MHTVGINDTIHNACSLFVFRPFPPCFLAGVHQNWRHPSRHALKNLGQNGLARAPTDVVLVVTIQGVFTDIKVER